MMSKHRRIRVGRINYTNVWPVFYNLRYEELGNRIEIVNQVPSQLNQAMARGDIDMGPISSFAYADAFPNYLLYPDLSVSALGRVNSILLFHREPLEQIANGRIALPNTSASSTHLLKIILQKFYGGHPSYYTSDPNLDKMMVNHDAALLIGDDAIKASWVNTRYLVTDLGEEWYRLTGQWMSFAVWAIRKDTALLYPDEVALLFRCFAESKHQGMIDPEPMILEAHSRLGGTVHYWRHYFKNLCYDFGAEQQQGLMTYFQYAKQLGLLDKNVTIELWSDKTNMAFMPRF